MPSPEQMAKKVAPSRHMVWYREIVPATLPVLFLGTGIFFTLTLIQTHLSHSKSLEDSGARISALEDELRELRESQRRQAQDWGMGLGTVVRRVRDLGREVHHVVDHVDASHQETTKSAQQTTQQLKETTTSTLSPLVHAAGEKMDHLRDTTTQLATKVSNEVDRRFETLPARADPSTADASLAQRLIATFGNPWSDARQTRREMEALQSQAAHEIEMTKERLASIDVKDALARAEEKLASVDIKDSLARAEEKLESVVTPLAAATKDTLVRVEEKFESAVTPLAAATGEKMDQLRETTTEMATRLSDEFEHRVETLPERADPTTADASLAQRLIATFGNPWSDARRTRQELEALESSAGRAVEQAAHEIEVAKQRLANVDVKDAIERAETKVESVVTPLAVATGEKMDSLRHTAINRATHLKDDLSTTVNTTSDAIHHRINELPDRGIDNADQGVDPVLASRLVATFGNAHDDARATRQEAVELAPGGEKTVADLERGVRGAKGAVERAWERTESAVEDTLEREKAKVTSRWWSKS